MYQDPQLMKAPESNSEAPPFVDFLSILVVTVSLSGLGLISLISLARTLGWIV
jgi:hypothetical protein